MTWRWVVIYVGWFHRLHRPIRRDDF